MGLMGGGRRGSSPEITDTYETADLGDAALPNSRFGISPEGRAED